jgi:hypothetical protein
MRRAGLALAVLAAIPAIALPLLACVAAISIPAQDHDGERAPDVSKPIEGFGTNVGDYAQR